MASSQDYEPTSSHGGYMSDLSLTLHFHHQALIFGISILLIVALVLIVICFFNFARHILSITTVSTTIAAAQGGGVEAVGGGATRNKGLDEASINSLPVYLHSSLAPFSEEDGNGNGIINIRENECAICLGPFEGNEFIKVIPTCLHAYHSPCVEKWLKTQAICPLCRATLPSLHHQHLSTRTANQMLSQSLWF